MAEQEVRDKAPTKKDRASYTTQKTLSEFQEKHAEPYSGGTEGFRLTATKDGSGFILELMRWHGNSPAPSHYGIFIFHNKLIASLHEATGKALRELNDV